MSDSSNLGKWTPWYGELAPDAAPQAYGDSDAYTIGAEWLKNCAVVEDWGCGLGWAKQFYRPDQYRGVDGTASPFADEVDDLAVRDCDPVPGIFMRGVIEHDYRWDRILVNAYRLFTQRMCLVLFTPMVLRGPKEIAFVEPIGVPDLSFSIRNIVELVRSKDPISYAMRQIESPNTGYGVETIFFMEKDSAALPADEACWCS